MADATGLAGTGSLVIRINTAASVNAALCTPSRRTPGLSSPRGPTHGVFETHLFAVSSCRVFCRRDARFCCSWSSPGGGGARERPASSLGSFGLSIGRREMNRGQNKVQERRALLSDNTTPWTNILIYVTNYKRSRKRNCLKKETRFTLGASPDRADQASLLPPASLDVFEYVPPPSVALSPSLSLIIDAKLQYHLKSTKI